MEAVRAVVAAARPLAQPRRSSGAAAKPAAPVRTRREGRVVAWGRSERRRETVARARDYEAEEEDEDEDDDDEEEFDFRGAMR